MSSPARDDEWAREVARLLLRRVGYGEAARVLREEAGERQGRRRRVRSPEERAGLAADELVRARARRAIGDE